MGSLNRACIGLATTVVLIASAIAADTPHTPDDAPTTVYVSGEQGMLYSGPGEDFYPTGTIEQNATLEVYLQAPGGWLGVRPPKGSFSWVQAADAYLLPGGRLIEITNPAAVSWIGTSLGSAKQYRWQVELNPGEQLGVIGEQTTRGEGDQEILWYKISPPTGEFRWIPASSVTTQPITAKGKTRSNSTHAQSRRASGSDVVSAAYQTKSDSGVITLSSPGDYDSAARQSTAPFIVSGSYPRAPKPGEIINGEVVVGGEYAPGEIIDEQSMDVGFGEGSSADSGYYDGEYYEGEHVEGEYFEGEYVQGGVVDEGIHYDDSHGEVIYDGHDYIDGVVRSTSKGAFAGWHALELTDDGMQFTWLERMYGRARKNGPDPLQADPFSLAMNKGQVSPDSPRAVEQMFPGGMPQTPHMQHATSASPRPRHRPWRDPRMLGGARSIRGNSPSVAPALSAHDRAGSSAGLSPMSVEASGIGAGLQRLADAFNSGSDPRMPSQMDTHGSAAGGVNWYGLGSGKTPASLAGHQTSAATTTAESLPAAARNLDLDQLQLTLSEAVTQPMQMWSLQPIYDSARYYVEHGASAIERGHARLLMGW